MTRLRFTKMHGLGNDFVVIDAIGQSVTMTDVLARQIADRRRGVGCDQVLLVEPARLPGTAFHYRIFNADGSEVEQCGNGARCFARFVREHDLSSDARIRVGTAAGPITLNLMPDGQVQVDMGIPRFEPAEIPMRVPNRAPAYNLGRGCNAKRIGAVSMGNPHAVLEVAHVDEAPVTTMGPLIETDPMFPNRVNVGFMQVIDEARLRLRVWERGTGETEACGTGACAAVAVGRIWGELGERVQVSLPGGDLVIDWLGEGEPMLMTGPATTVFEGEIALS